MAQLRLRYTHRESMISWFIFTAGLRSADRALCVYYDLYFSTWWRLVWTCLSIFSKKVKVANNVPSIPIEDGEKFDWKYDVKVEERKADKSYFSWSVRTEKAPRGKRFGFIFFLALGHKFRLGPILYFEIEFFYFTSHLISISSPLSFCLFFSIYWSGIRTYNLRYITYDKYLSLPIGEFWCMADFTLNTKASWIDIALSFCKLSFIKYHLRLG